MKESCRQNVEKRGNNDVVHQLHAYKRSQKGGGERKQTQTRKGEMNNRKINFVRIVKEERKQIQNLYKDVMMRNHISMRLCKCYLRFEEKNIERYPNEERKKGRESNSEGRERENKIARKMPNEEILSAKCGKTCCRFNICSIYSKPEKQRGKR